MGMFAPPSSMAALTQDSFIRWLSESNREIRSTIAADANDDDDEEIGVFAAEKYFNEDDDHPQHGLRKNGESALLELEKMNIHLKSPSAMSESSCPSQTALVNSFSSIRTQRNAGKKKNKRKTKSILTAICRCSCAGENSVDVRDEDTKPKMKIVYPRERYVSYSSLSRDSPMKLRLKEKVEERETLERKTVVLNPWEAVPPKLQEATEVSASSGIRYNNDDDSDASSDLIEIESLSGKVISYFARQDSGVASCYAPSETSIEWSVATASAANISVRSDYDPEVGAPTSKNISWKDWCRHRSPAMQIQPPPPPVEDRSRRLSTSQLPPFSLSRAEPFRRSVDFPGSSEKSLLLKGRRSPHDSRWLYI